MKEKSKFERIFTLSSIITLCVSVGILVLAFMGIMPINRFFLDLFLILTILAFGCVASLSAIKMIIIDKKNIYGYVLLGMNALICLLWVVCIFVAKGLIDAILAEVVTLGDFANAWGFVKTTIFLSLLQSFASLIINNWLKYKKKNLVLQIVMYACNLIVTLWLSILVLSLVMTDNGIIYTANWLLDSALIAAVFVLALVFSGVTKLILRNITRREERELVANTLATQKAMELNKLQQNSENKEESDTEIKNDPWAQE